jgi:hypothetical protein
MGLTLERYLFVKQKSVAKQTDRSKMIVYIVSMWTFASAFALVKTVWIQLSYHIEVDAYACDSQFDYKFEIIYTFSKWFIAFVLPYAVIILVSCFLLCFLNKWSDKPRPLGSIQTNRANKQKAMKRKSTKFVLAVVLSFLYTWSPLWIYQCIILFTEFESFAIIIGSNITLILVYLGGVMDPLLYMILTENFEKEKEHDFDGKGIREKNSQKNFQIVNLFIFNFLKHSIS